MVMEAAPPRVHHGVLREDGGKFFLVGGGRIAGRVHHLNETSVKATCSLHAKCMCWVTGHKCPEGKTREDLRPDLIEWLAQGVPPCTSESHACSARELKRQWGMRVRG